MKGSDSVTVVSFPADIFAHLLEHLEQPEQVAFMLAESDETRRVFRVADIRTYETGGSFSRTSSKHEDLIRSEVITWAWPTDSCLIEAHSHGPWFSPVCFSRFDLEQLDEWVPHVRWRLADRPYLAIVTAGREVDGLAWIGDGPPTAIEKLLIDNAEDIPTTRESIARVQPDE